MTVTVRREVVLPVAPDELWPALTEGGRMGEWFGADVEVDLRPGGRMTFRWTDVTRRGVVEAVEPNRRLAFRLDAVADGTRLRVTESGFDGGAQRPSIVACLGAHAGWGSVISRLGGV